MSPVFANGRLILHAGDGLKHTAAPPDVCKTPSPGGPVPIPYVNVASDSDLAKGATTVEIEENPVALESSNLSTSMGDEPGTAGGGLVSSKTKGKLTWGTSSADVKIEGKGVVRFMDVAQHNGNSFNTAFISAGRAGTGFAYGDDFTGECPVCKKGPDDHAVLERPEGSLETAREILEDLKKAEDAWSKANQKVESAAAALKRQVETNPKIKPTTVEAKQLEIAGLEKARDALGSHRRDSSTGYMFGVMVCLKGKKFAAVSGRETPDGFETIAEAHGCTVITDPATLDDFKAINPLCKAGKEGAGAAVEAQWGMAVTKHEAGEKEYNNQPGTCAGAKLIGKSGHVADSMTEIYFSFTGGKRALTFNVIYRGPTGLGPSDGPWTAPTKDDLEDDSGGAYVEERRDMRRKKETTVPSCRSCQDTLFMARCDADKQDCG